MEIKQEGNVLTIRTAENWLAAKLGRNIYDPPSGNLGYEWEK
jgi:hypothetical protein